MPAFLHPCPHCQRHIRCDETTCPFCAQNVGARCDSVPIRHGSVRRMSRAALVALGTATTGTVMAACDGTSMVAVYGAPASGASFNGTGGDETVGTGGKPSGAGGTLSTGGDSLQPVYGASPTTGGTFNTSGGSDMGGGAMGGDSMGGAPSVEED